MASIMASPSSSLLSDDCTFSLFGVAGDSQRPGPVKRACKKIIFSQDQASAQRPIVKRERSEMAEDSENQPDNENVSRRLQAIKSAKRNPDDFVRKGIRFCSAALPFASSNQSQSSGCSHKAEAANQQAESPRDLSQKQEAIRVIPAKMPRGVEHSAPILFSYVF
ncbi:MAG: hypothetical protein Q8P67_23220 [archaeon]|nr:hypothetical protein [archaeon]